MGSALFFGRNILKGVNNLGFDRAEPFQDGSLS
jgi:hypothetical protein